MEDLLEQGGPLDGPAEIEAGSGYGTIDIEDGPQDGPEVNADEAAALLGILVRAVLKRLKKGTLQGRKVTTKYGEKWLVLRANLPTAVQVEMSQGGPQDGPSTEQGGIGA